jgi:Ca-activated chloride channel family protein
VAPTRPGDALEVRVEIDAGTPIAEAASPSHEVRVERPAADRAVLTLVPRPEVPNRDFVVRHHVAAPETRAALLASRERDGRGTFTLLLHPPERPAPAEVAPRELVVLVDASSSMAGRPFETARALAADVARTLGPGDTLRVVAFADRAQSMAPEALPGGPGSVARAERFLEGISPQGGTELSAAVNAALGAPADPRRLRTVLLVSDGNVGDDVIVLQLVANALGDARLHTIGVGGAPNRWLLERAAELGRGTSTLVGLAEDPGPIGLLLAAKLARPVLTDLSIDWGGLPVRDVYPRILPDLHAGEPLVVIGRYDGAATGTVQLRGRRGDGAWSRAVGVTLPERDTRHEALGVLWGRRRVQELETAQLVRPSPELREQIARIGLEHSLVTSETSLVAVARGAPPSAPPASQVPTPTPSPAAAGDAAWSAASQSDYWRDELGTYRSALDLAPGAASAGADLQFELGVVEGQLERPDGELALARRAMIGPSGAYARVLSARAPIMNAQIAPPPATPRGRRDHDPSRRHRRVHPGAVGDPS